MLTIPLDQIDSWRIELADYPAVLRAMEAIADCEGDVEDAAIGLAIQADLEPNTCDRWLKSFAKRFRPRVCQPDFCNRLASKDVVALTRYLAAESSCPELLALPVAIEIMGQGIESFCQGFLSENY
jgi:hypothetical protein